MSRKSDIPIQVIAQRWRVETVSHFDLLWVLLVLNLLALVGWLRQRWARYISRRQAFLQAVRLQRAVPWYRQPATRARVLRYPPAVRDRVEERDGMKVVAWSNLFMFDWDVGPDKEFKTREEVLDFVLSTGPRHALRLYKTPGGVRGFAIHWMRYPDAYWESWQEYATDLQCDPAYVELCPVRGACACRVGPKEGRDGDYVAEYWITVGHGSQEIREGLVEQIQLHDQWCKEYRPNGVAVPVIHEPVDLRDSVLWSMEQEPWEPIHKAVLADLDMENPQEADECLVIWWMEEDVQVRDLDEEEIPF